MEPRTGAARRGQTHRVSLPVAIAGGSLVLAALTLLLPSVPTYDPWSWIIWGREITQLDLDTVDGPSWKPLPVLFTTIFALAGDAAPDLWLVVARAGAIAALPLAYLLAARVAGPVAGLAAAAGIGAAPYWLRHGALGNSEGLLVALLFAAVLVHAHGRRGQSFALAVAVGLLRPEAWPFVGLYALWLLFDDRGRLPWVAAGLVSLPVLWLGPELWGSGNALRASDRAQQPNPNSAAFADNPPLAVLEDAVDMVPLAALAGLVLLLGVVALRRLDGEARRLVPALGAMAVGWLGLVAVMTAGGFSGNQRYLMPPAALFVVLGAAGLVLAGRALWGERGRAIPAVAVAALVAAGLFAADGAGRLDDELEGIEYQVTLTDALPVLIEDGGGAEHLRRCGHPYTNPFLVPQVAWYLGLHGRQVGLDPDARRPAVVFHVQHTPSAAGRAPAWSRRGETELAREANWILTADCDPAPR